jgi:hypothetical protein
MTNPVIDQYGKHWYNEKREYHREDGSAREYADGDKEWWYYGERIDCSTQKEFEKIIKLRMFL